MLIYYFCSNTKNKYYHDNIYHSAGCANPWLYSIWPLCQHKTIRPRRNTKNSGTDHDRRSRLHTTAHMENLYDSVP